MLKGRPQMTRMDTDEETGRGMDAEQIVPRAEALRRREWREAQETRR